MEPIRSLKDVCVFQDLFQDLSGKAHTHTQNDLHLGESYTHRKKQEGYIPRMLVEVIFSG